MTVPRRFFMVILPSDIEEKKLRIPESFRTRFGHELSSVATLQVRNNADLWKVELAKIGEDLYFKDGWHRFLQHHSIIASFFLVFNYIGNSSFDVVIFDRHTIQVHFGDEMDDDTDHDDEEDEDEIEKHDEDEDYYENEDDENDDDYDEEDDDDYYDDEDEDEDEDDDDSLEILHSSPFPYSKNKGTYSKNKETKMSRTKSKSNHCSSMRKHGKNAKKGESNNPSLTVTLKPYHVNPNCYLNVPASFATVCTRGRPEFIILRNVRDGSECFVTMVYSSAWKLSKGWPKFVKTNNLQQGDICTFKLMQGTKNVVIEVTIVRAKKVARS